MNNLCKAIGFADCEFAFNPDENNPGKVVDHLTDTHGLSIKHGAEVVTKVEGVRNKNGNTFGVPFILKYGVSRNPYRTSFVITATRHPVKNVVSWHCIFIGETTHQESSDFVVKLRVDSASKEVNDLRWRIPSMSATQVHEAIKLGYFPLPRNILEEYYTSKEGTLQISFSIQRITSSDMKIGLEPNLWKLQIPWKNPWKYLNVDTGEKTLENIEKSQTIEKIEEQEDVPPEPVIFKKATCSSCGITPLQDKLYKCLQCPSFTICHMCKERGLHSKHVFALITSLEQNKIIWDKLVLPNPTDKSAIQEIQHYSTLLPPVCNGVVIEETKERCGSSRVQYICLQCPYLFLCESCQFMETHNLMVTSSSAHNNTHIFAVPCSDEQRKFLKGHLIYKYPILVPDKRDQKKKN